MQHPLFDVFISYAHQDIEWAKWLHTDLSRRGLEVFLDDAVLRFGDNVPAQIEKSLEHSICVLLLLSRQSRDSAWVQFESSFNWSTTFIEGKRRLVPVLIDKAVELPARLRSLRSCDLTDRDDAVLQHLVDDLLSRRDLDIGPYRLDRAQGLSEDLAKKIVNCLTRYLKPAPHKLLILETAMTELVDNAFRHTNKGRSSLSVHANSNCAEVVIEDGGDGFDLRDALTLAGRQIERDPTAVGGRGLALLQAQGVLLQNGRHNAGEHWVKATVWWRSSSTHSAAEPLINSHANGSLTVSLSGRLDQYSVGSFDASLAQYLHGPKTRGIVFDLRQVEYASSVGLRALMVVAKVARKNGFEVYLAGLQPVVADIFKISRFDRIFPIFDSTDAAEKALDATLSK